MIIDSKLEFCDAVSAVQAASTTALIGDVVDLSTASEDQGTVDDPLYLVITVDTAFASADSNPVHFELASDAAAAIAVDGSASQHVVSPTYDVSELTAGRKLVFALPSGVSKAYEQYLGLLLVTGAGASGVTAGKVNAFLTKDAGQNVAYPDAI